MKKYVLLLIALANYCSISAQIYNYPYIEMEEEIYDELTVGDKIFLIGDPDEYTITSIGNSFIPIYNKGARQTFCLSKTKEHMGRLSDFSSVVGTDICDYFSRFKSKIREIVKTDYQERVFKYPLHTVVYFEEDGKTRFGAISYVSPFSDQLEITIVKKDGELERFIVDEKQLLDSPGLEDMSAQDSLQWIYVSQFWNNDQQIFNDKYPHLGNVLLAVGDTVHLRAPDAENLYADEWFSLRSKWKRKGDLSTQKYKKLDKSYWRYDNGLLSIYEVGKVVELPKKRPKSSYKKDENMLNLELGLRLVEISPKSITYVLVEKECTTILPKPDLNACHWHDSHYSYDSAFMTRDLSEVIHLGDLITLKNDTSKYFVYNLTYHVELSKTTQNRTSRIYLRNFFEKLENIEGHNYNNIIDIKQKFPLRSKVQVGENGTGYIESYDFYKQTCEYVQYDEKQCNKGTIPISELSPVDQKLVSFEDTIARVLDSQGWNHSFLLFKYHSPESGKIALSIGDTLTYKANSYDGTPSAAVARFDEARRTSKRKPIERDVGEGYIMNYGDSSFRFEGFDISNRSKANLEMDGTWKLDKDVITISVIGRSMTWAPTEQDRSQKTLKAHNIWKHKLKLKIVDISDKHISYILQDKKSEQLN